MTRLPVTPGARLMAQNTELQPGRVVCGNDLLDSTHVVPPCVGEAPGTVAFQVPWDVAHAFVSEGVTLAPLDPKTYPLYY